MLDTPQSPLVQVRGLKMHFPILAGVFRRHVGHIKAVDDISLDIFQSETLGLVGESGCGKSTAGRAIIRLYELTSGSVTIDGTKLGELDNGALRKMRPKMQMIFQDPQASLNPRMTVADIIGEPLIEHMELSRAERLERAYTLMDAVGLNRSFAERYPHEFSGGQCQRIGIARALALHPNSSSATNRSQRSTSPSRRRSSTCLKTCRSNSGLPTSSSVTICRWFAISPIGWLSCISARLSS